MLDKVKAGPDEQWFNFKIKQFHYGEDDDAESMLSVDRASYV